ncbi:hypothetical protein Tco_0138779 [Tanacetum coccineum]
MIDAPTPELKESSIFTLVGITGGPARPEDGAPALLPPLCRPLQLLLYKILIRDEPPTPFWSNTEVARLLAIPTPPPSPLSMVITMTQIPSPPLPPILSPLYLYHFPHNASPIFPVGLSLSDAPSSGTPPLLPIPLPTSSPPLHLLSTNCRANRPEVTLPHRKRQDTDKIYTRLDDELTERQLMADRLNMLYRGRRAHARTARLIEAEARMSREA